VNILREKIENLGLIDPIGILVQPEETIRFLEFLPDLEWHQAYVSLLIVRSSGLKEKYGFKGSDHVLSIKVIPGSVEDPKFRLYLNLRRLCLLADHSQELYSYRHKDTLFMIPKNVVAVMISPNPADWVRASVDTITEFLNGMRESIVGSIQLRRLDTLLGANCMRRFRHLFHMIDIDDPSLVPEILEKVQEILGYIPARIFTRRGVHLLIKVSSFNKNQAKKWFLTIPDFVKSLNTSEEKTLVEYKTNFLDPLPGSVYKGIVPVFKEPEG